MQTLIKTILFTGALTLAAPLTAQTPAAPAAPDARAELEAARHELAEAARRVAELSASEADRWIREFDLRRVAMPRVRLGVVLGAETDVKDGLLVRSVSRDGPADKAGLKRGDVLLKVDARDLAGASATTLIDEVLMNKSPGDVVAVRYRRGDAVHDASVTLAERDELAAFAFGRGDSPRVFSIPGMPSVAPFLRGHAFGDYQLVRMSKDLGKYFNTDRGLLVVGVGEENPFTLKDGDVILSIGDREPESATHAVRILRSYVSGEEAELEIMRERRKQKLKVVMPVQ